MRRITAMTYACAAGMLAFQGVPSVARARIDSLQKILEKNSAPPCEVQLSFHTSYGCCSPMGAAKAPRARLCHPMRLSGCIVEHPPSPPAFWYPIRYCFGFLRRIPRRESSHALGMDQVDEQQLNLCTKPETKSGLGLERFRA